MRRDTEYESLCLRASVVRVVFVSAPGLRISITTESPRHRERESLWRCAASCRSPRCEETQNMNLCAFVPLWFVLSLFLRRASASRSLRSHQETENVSLCGAAPRRVDHRHANNPGR